MQNTSYALDAQIQSGNLTNLTATRIFADYQSYPTLTAFFNTLPNVTQVTIGTSFLGREIYGFQFGSGTQHIVFHGCIHSREWISCASVAYVGYMLATDTKYENLRKRFRFTVVPVLNVDGYAFTRDFVNGDRFWRKNMQPNFGTGLPRGIPGGLGRGGMGNSSVGMCDGTDPNRNFGYEWGIQNDGASDNPCDPSYLGPAPYSAPETKAITDYILSLGNVVSYIDFHAYSNLWMFPNGYTCTTRVKDYDTLLAGSSLAVKALTSVNGLPFINGDVCNTIYAATGSSCDWAYHIANITYAYAVELRGEEREGGFIVPPEQIVLSGREVLAGVVALWEYVAEKVPLTSTSADRGAFAGNGAASKSDALCGITVGNVALVPGVFLVMTMLGLFI
ncbi:hypothetical protein HDV05_001658 [Chytridiales sp. JEL 0842]|nr:hypothetical protein HDV05_001658 [Chytridiales sp. JEL 0842]